ncbi:MAG: hypothetical protein AABY87_12945 [bacterium]
MASSTSKRKVKTARKRAKMDRNKSDMVTLATRRRKQKKDLLLPDKGDA